MSAPNAKTPVGDDLAPTRESIRAHCTAFGVCDFDSVNALMTLKRTAADFENFAASYFKQYDLSPGRYNVLMQLYGRPDRTLSLSELGDNLLVTRANITGLVDGLVEDGLLERIDHPEDRRVVLARLTDKAIKFLDWFAPRHHRNIKELLSALTIDEKRQLTVLLDKVRALFHKYGTFDIVESRSAVQS
jgi:MarR family transcriptional regulator, 2-MHQ and catechol-resistance regulon repressor